MTDAVAYLNGHLVPAREACLPVYDAGVVLGATVTEMTRTFRGQLFRLSDHLDRLFASLETARFDVGISRECLTHISHEIVEHNYRLCPAGGDLGLIHFVTAGAHATYAGMADHPVRQGPTVCIHTFPLPFAHWAEKMRSGARLVTPAVRNVPAECYSPHMKCRSRMHYYLAEQQAHDVDPAASALLLDLAGWVTETPAANFLIVERGGIVSPPSDKVLTGVSRQQVIELAAELGIGYAERDLKVEDALRADEALLTGTPYCLLPVVRLNDQPIGAGKPGATFERLLNAWSTQVGLDIREQLLAAPGHH